MTDNNSGWVYVIVCEPGKDESLLGLNDSKTGENFIPTFKKKHGAESCFLSLPKEPGKKYEVQAIHIEELTKNCEENGFAIAMIDEQGNIVE